MLTFICIIAEIMLLFFVYRIFEVQQPRVIFSKEIRGVNIKEDEYISRKVTGPTLK